MAEQPWHFLKFIYSSSRSPPASQIKKCSKSVNPKLYQSELYVIFFSGDFSPIFSTLKLFQVDYDFFFFSFGLSPLLRINCQIISTYNSWRVDYFFFFK